MFIIRIWLEPGPQFRARLTSSLDVVNGDEQVRVVASPEAVVDSVRAWLVEFVQPGT